MKKLTFEQLKSYLQSKDLHIGVHCTNLGIYPSIQQYGIAHDGRIDSTVNFSIRNLDHIKTIVHKQSNCVVVVAIPKKIFNILYKTAKSYNKNVYETNFFCNIAPKANLSGMFVLSPQYILGVFNNKTQLFYVNENFILEQQNAEDLINEAINKLETENDLKVNI